MRARISYGAYPGERSKDGPATPNLVASLVSYNYIKFSGLSMCSDPLEARVIICRLPTALERTMTGGGLMDRYGQLADWTLWRGGVPDQGVPRTNTRIEEGGRSRIGSDVMRVARWEDIIHISK